MVTYTLLHLERVNLKCTTYVPYDLRYSDIVVHPLIITGQSYYIMHVKFFFTGLMMQTNQHSSLKKTNCPMVLRLMNTSVDVSLRPYVVCHLS